MSKLVNYLSFKFILDYKGLQKLYYKGISFVMNQFIIYLLSGLFIGICEKIDTAFGNNISIDAICVLSAYTVITWVTYCVYQIGSYSYRVLLKKEKNCFVLTMLFSCILSCFVYWLSDKIPHLYTLTENQYNLFGSCLRIHAFCIPLMGIGDYLYTYLLLQCKNKLIWLANIIFYTLMILFDAIVCYKGYDLDMLILVTGLAYFIYDIIVVIYSGILYTDDIISIENMKECFKHGFNILTDRLLGKVATVTYNVYASKLGTELYAIHSICYSIATFTENLTNQQYNYQVLRLAAFDNIKEKWINCKKIMKETSLILVILSYVSSFILLIVIRGEVSLKICIVPLILYCSQCLFIQFYESLRGFLTSLQRSDLLKWAGLIGIFTRIPLILFCYYCNLGIYGFALLSTIDFTCRGLYFYFCKNYLLRKESL